MSVLAWWPTAGTPTVDLVLFPGGGNGPAAFEPWRPLVPPRWRVGTVCLPGRGYRLAEPLPTSLPALADEIVDALRPTSVAAPVFFGHSLGALLAFEVATRLNPTLLVTAACAPTVDPTVYGDPDPEKVRDVVRRRAARQGITDPAFVEELADVAAPILRADLLLLDGYRLPAARTAADIVSYYGHQDPVPPTSWAGRTTGAAEVVVVPGDHHFFSAAPDRLVADLAHRVSALC